MAVSERFIDAEREGLQQIPSIEGFEQQPLVTFEEAVTKVQSIVYPYDEMVRNAKKASFYSSDGLTVDEAAAVRLYTMNHWYQEQSIAIKLNGILRLGIPSHFTSWSSYVKIITSALNKLPPVKGTIWRAGRGLIADMYQNSCLWSGFSSCTKNPSVVERLLREYGVYTLFEIECLNGKSICKYSEHPDEDEVLLMPGTRLRVIRKENLTFRITKVYMKEEESSNRQESNLLDSLSTRNQQYTKDKNLHRTSNPVTAEIKPAPFHPKYSNQSLEHSNVNQTHPDQTMSLQTTKSNDIHIKTPVPPVATQRFTDKQNQYSDSSKSWLACIHRDNAKTVIMTPEDLQAKLYDPPTTANVNILNRVKGSIFGMTVGDALGAHVEFRPRQYLEENPVRDFQEGGTWGLKKGQFTDDTSMGLCLASSLICRRDFIPYDQLVRYKWWYRYGYMSSTGQCFDIGSATSQSLHEFEYRQRSFANRYNIPLDQIDFISDLELLKKFDVHCSEKGVAGNGALMRLAPVPLFFHRYPIRAVEFSGVSGVITHGDQKAYDACRYYGALIVAAVRGETKAQLLDRDFYWNHREWFDSKPLTQEVMDIAQGSYKKPGGYRDGIRGKGYILSAVEAALWAFWNDGNSFEKGVLDAVNLGDDTDTTAAIYGQLAGAYYGYDHIPMKWTEKVYARKFITCICKWIVYEGESWNTHSSVSGEAEPTVNHNVKVSADAKFESSASKDRQAEHISAYDVTHNYRYLRPLRMNEPIHSTGVRSQSYHESDSVSQPNVFSDYKKMSESYGNRNRSGFQDKDAFSTSFNDRSLNTYAGGVRYGSSSVYPSIHAQPSHLDVGRSNSWYTGASSRGNIPSYDRNLS